MAHDIQNEQEHPFILQIKQRPVDMVGWVAKAMTFREARSVAASQSTPAVSASQTAANAAAIAGSSIHPSLQASMMAPVMPASAPADVPASVGQGLGITTEEDPVKSV